MTKNILYLIDGTSLCYRSFFALKLTNSRGFPTGVVYGFYQTLKKIIDKYKPSYVGVCFDVSRKTFRQEKFKEYKINRPPVPDGLKAQIPLVKKLINALGIKIIEKEGFEADDVIASLCKKARQIDYGVVIVSSDKDLYQLIDKDKVSVYNYNKDKFITKKDFLKEYGFDPQLITDYLSLTGDSIDNVPGAKGIGKVGAAKLIGEFGSLKNIFNNLDKLPQKLKKILTDNKREVFLSRELVELCPCHLKLNLQDLKVKESDTTQIYKMFSELEFKSLLKEIPTPSLDLKVKVKEGILKNLLQQLTREPLVFSSEKNNIFIYDYKDKCIYKSNFANVKEILQDSKVKKVSFDFKNELSCLSGIKGLYFDVKIAAYLLDSSLGDYSLSNLVSRYLGKHLAQIPPKVSSYFIYQLYKLFAPQLKEEELEKLFFEVEMPLIEVLAKMQDDGVVVNTDILDELLKKVQKQINETKRGIFKIAGREFNLNSPKQLGVILFEDLGIQPLKKTKTGYSTNEEVLEKLSLQYPIAELILDYRQLNKLKTTYISPLIEQVNSSKGVLHTQFNQTVTQTGRLSSSSPNLQSIPVKGEFSNLLRKAFVSSFKEGYIFSGDYSQIELRILAHLSCDDNLIQAFMHDLDIHTHTATLLFGVESQEVDEYQRNLAKRINFGIVYGMGSYGLSKELKISTTEAQNFIDDYFRRYPKVKDYIHRIETEAQRKGFVRTILGRRRKLPDIESANVQLREFARRQAINAPIQGSCADLIKAAMVRINNELKQKKLRTKLIIQIHDELIFDVPAEELSDVKTIVKEHMEKALKLSVPIKVNIKCGKNWADAKEIK